MAQLTYRQAVAEALGRAMEQDERVVVLGEDVRAGGVFKTVAGLYERFGGDRVWNTAISEQAILGAAMGAAMNGLRPVAEIMFADFVGVCYDYLVNQIPKFRYMTGGQIEVPLVVRAHNGAGVRFGAQHSQNIESWLMAIPGLKVVVPSTPADVVGLLTAAIRDPDPVVFLEHKALLGTRGEVTDADWDDELGRAKVLRQGDDALIVTLGAMVPRALQAADTLAEQGISCGVVDLRSLIPLDIQTVMTEAARVRRVFTLEENPRPCGWGAEVSSLLAERAYDALRGPIVRITMPYVPVPASGVLEDAARPSVERVVEEVRAALG